jgi:Glutamine amidotransferases class-II.
MVYLDDRYDRIPSGCSVFGVINVNRVRFDWRPAVTGIASMHERSNGLGGGFAVYGLYPEYKETMCLHIMYDDKASREETEDYLRDMCRIIYEEKLPVRRTVSIFNGPEIKRYFVEPIHDILVSSEEEYFRCLTMEINRSINGAFVLSCGKDMGIFKGVGYPEDIAEYFRLDEYKGYIWTAHGRFPTNTPGWWGGAHPFGILDVSVVHNGELSSYGANRKFLRGYGYKCVLQTDTEVIAYLYDLLVKKHRLPEEIAMKVMSPPLWDEIERMDEQERVLYTSLRVIYARAALNGPFSVIIATTKGMAVLCDRLKLRPMVTAKDGEYFIASSEESAIAASGFSTANCYMPRGGEPVFVPLNEEYVEESVAV